MKDETLRQHIVDAINDLTQLLELCEDPDQRQALRLKIRELFIQLDEIIVAKIDNDSHAFSEAITALQTLSTQAQEAAEDLEIVATTLSKAADVIEKISKLAKNSIKAAAILS